MDLIPWQLQGELDKKGIIRQPAWFSPRFHLFNNNLSLAANLTTRGICGTLSRNPSTIKDIDDE